MSPFAMGVLTEIFFSLRLASESDTSVYVSSAPVLVLRMVTLLRICTLSVESLDSSMIRALLTSALSWAIFPSRRPWASLAASYSAFSDKSPLSRASAIWREISGRCTDSSSLISAMSLS